MQILFTSQKFYSNVRQINHDTRYTSLATFSDIQHSPIPFDFAKNWSWVKTECNLLLCIPFTDSCFRINSNLFFFYTSISWTSYFLPASFSFAFKCYFIHQSVRSTDWLSAGFHSENLLVKIGKVMNWGLGVWLFFVSSVFMIFDVKITFLYIFILM